MHQTAAKPTLANQRRWKRRQRSASGGGQLRSTNCGTPRCCLTVTAQGFQALQDLQPYGDIVLSKLECVNHAHKRMGIAFRKLTEQDKLGGQGEGRLTADKCHILQ